MKTWLIFQLLVQLGVLHIFALRIREHFYFSAFNDKILSLNQNSIQSLTQDRQSRLLESRDVCNNLFEYLLVFGPDAIKEYSTCDDKYFLLGEKNSLIVKDKPECFLNLIPTLCKSKIQKNVTLPYPDDIRYFMTKTISRCIRSQFYPSNEHNYTCPTLNFQTGMIEDKKRFCQDIEAMHQFDSGLIQPDNNENPLFRVYNFISKNAYQPCLEISDIFNFCVDTSNKLGIDKYQCFTNKFILYNEGGFITQYDVESQNQCSNFILPFFGFMTSQKNLLQPSNSFAFCEDIEKRIIEQLELKQWELKKDLNFSKGNQSLYERYSHSLITIQKKSLLVITRNDEIKTKWRSIYDYLTNEQKLDFVNMSAIVEEHINLLNDTLLDWVMTSRHSLEFLKGLSTQSTLFNNSKILVDNFGKINTLNQHMLNLTTFLQGLFLLKVPDNLEKNLVSKEENIVLKTEKLKTANSLLEEAMKNFRDFVILFETKFSIENKNYQAQIAINQEKVAKLETLLSALTEQQNSVNKFYFT